MPLYSATTRNVKTSFMISHESKKEAIRSFKEQKPQMGTYAVRCAVTGNVWVGASKNLPATNNGCWFMLRIGTHQDKSLQQEWNAHGESTFSFEILECVDPETPALVLGDQLKEILMKSVTRLNAKKLL